MLSNSSINDETPSKFISIETETVEEIQEPQIAVESKPKLSLLERYRLLSKNIEINDMISKNLFSYLENKWSTLDDLDVNRFCIYIFIS